MGNMADLPDLSGGEYSIVELVVARAKEERVASGSVEGVHVNVQLYSEREDGGRYWFVTAGAVGDARKFNFTKTYSSLKDAELAFEWLVDKHNLEEL